MINFGSLQLFNFDRALASRGRGLPDLPEPLRPGGLHPPPPLLPPLRPAPIDRKLIHIDRKMHTTAVAVSRKVRGQDPRRRRILKEMSTDFDESDAEAAIFQIIPKKC